MRKLCINCAYRANCQKRFGVTIVNDEVRCMDYEPDFQLLKKEKEEQARNEEKPQEKKDE